jgi:hypothetical protein
LTEQGVVGKAPSLVLDVHTVTEKKKRKWIRLRDGCRIGWAKFFKIIPQPLGSALGA